MHGGLFYRDGVKLADIAAISRKREPPDESNSLMSVPLGAAVRV